MDLRQPLAQGRLVRRERLAERAGVQGVEAAGQAGAEPSIGWVPSALARAAYSFFRSPATKVRTP